jgi:hypothetical protein
MRLCPRHLISPHQAWKNGSRVTSVEFLQGAKFRPTKLITDVFLGLSYEPGFGIPTFRLDLTG